MRRSMKYDLNNNYNNNKNNMINNIKEIDGRQDQQQMKPITINGLAVVVDSVAFNYKQNIPLLKDVSINVPKGVIYTLLGSNGCGKTTLLNILLGRIKPHKGNLTILGQSPGPLLNHLIGYMPQELGLNPLLYIQDTFYYFAQVNHIKDKIFIQEQIRNYLEMLDLQDPKKRVGELSGGQKRLLSLGVTLIYKPKILLLDEPTVGIDSLIRSKIWIHLKQLCYLNQTTVIITTHYIDEAKQSNLVGFLHEGQLLAEESPEVLMQYLGCKTLEQVFLKLCCQKKDDQRNNNNSNSNKEVYFKYHNLYSDIINGETFINDLDINYGNYANNSYSENCSTFGQNSENSIIIDNNNNNTNSHGKFFILNEKHPLELNHEKNSCNRHYLNIDHLIALMCREWFFFTHNILLFLVYLLMPILTIYLFDSSYGRTPKQVPIAIFNGDESEFEPHLSDIFLNEFNTSMVKMNLFNSEEDAKRSVEMGKNIIAIAFRNNFSTALVERYYDFHSFDSHKKDVIAMDGSMHLYIDHSSLLNVRYVNRSILLAFQRTIERFGATRGINPQIFSLPIDKKEYVYGVLEPHFQDLFTPGIIIITLLAMNAAKSAFEIIYLHQNGSLKRDINQGVRPFEMIFTFVIASMTSIFWQTLSTLLFTFFIMNVQLDGDFISAFILVFTTTCQGLFIGTLLSVLFPDQIISMLLCFTTLVIMFFTSGTLWPIEGMAPTLQKIFMINPIVLPVRSLRFIMLRGWAISNFSVLIGYIISIGTCCILFILSSFFFHYLNIRIK